MTTTPWYNKLREVRRAYDKEHAMKGGMSKKYGKTRGVRKVEEVLRPKVSIVPSFTPFQMVWTLRDQNGVMLGDPFNSEAQAREWATKNKYRII